MMVNEVMLEIANFDVIPTEHLDQKIHYWPETEPYSVNYEMAGTESTFFLANIGFVMYPIYYHVLLVIVHASIHPLRNKSRHIEKLHTKIGSYFYWEGYNRFFMEIFLDVAFLSILNLHTADWASPFLSVKFSNALSVLFIVIACVTLIVYIAGYCRMQKELRAKTFGEKFSPLLEGTKYERKEPKSNIILVPVYFFMKRLILVAILIFAREFVWVQVALLNHMAIATLIFTLWFMPLESKLSNLVEAFNECTVLLLTYLLWSFAHIVREPETLFDLGYVVMGVIFGNVFLHLVLMLFQLGHSIKLRVKKYCNRRNVQK